MASTSFWLLIYLTDVTGLKPVLAGLALMIGRVWDALTDPIMGWISDHTNTRWGKRRPYILFGSIFYGSAYFAIWSVPEFRTQLSLFAYVSIVLLIFNTCFTVVFVPYTSLTAAMTADYNERTVLTGFRMTSSQIGFLLGGAVPSALVAWSTSPAGIAWLSSQSWSSAWGNWIGTARVGYLITGTLFAAIMITALSICALGTRENVRSTHQDRSKSPFRYLLQIASVFRTNRPFRLAVLIILLTNCAATFIGTNFAYYIQYVLKIREEQTAIVVALFLGAILAMPAWVLITKRYGKTETYCVAMGIYCMVLCSLLALSGGSVAWVYAVSIIAGTIYAAALLIPWAMVPDVVEYDQLQNGIRREGLFYGGTSFIYKLATALAIYCSATVLSIFGYTPNEPQGESTLVAMRILISLVPAGLLIAGILVARRYPLSRAKHKELVDSLSRPGPETSDKREL